MLFHVARPELTLYGGVAMNVDTLYEYEYYCIWMNRIHAPIWITVGIIGVLLSRTWTDVAHIMWGNEIKFNKHKCKREPIKYDLNWCYRRHRSAVPPIVLHSAHSPHIEASVYNLCEFVYTVNKIVGGDANWFRLWCVNRYF